jgi:hypothetical protein
VPERDWAKDYEALEREARQLVPLFNLGGSASPSSWGLGGLGAVFRGEDGKHELALHDDRVARRGLLLAIPADLDELRALAISLLVYCAAVSEGEPPSAS